MKPIPTHPSTEDKTHSHTESDSKENKTHPSSKNPETFSKNETYSSSKNSETSPKSETYSSSKSFKGSDDGYEV